MFVFEVWEELHLDIDSSTNKDPVGHNKMISNLKDIGSYIAQQLDSDV